ncbi:MAG: (d)CMP kinase [Planctomycetes bacterium]|nr:(d)CMP kinase [Planctomycetota bacterium]
MAKYVITIDGPAASGKSTVARAMAKKIGAVFLDTGSMYRAFTLAAMRSGCDLSDEDALKKALAGTDFDFDAANGRMNVFINGSDVTERIRDPEVTANVHYIAAVPALRAKLVEMQRAFAAEHEKIVTEGRDQGTVAFPDAKLKFFLTATARRRAVRRAKELKAKGSSSDIARIQRLLEERDQADADRKVGPLLRAGDAVEIDTTNMTIDEVLAKLIRYIKE